MGTSISELIAEASTFKKVELGDREKEFLYHIAEGFNTAYSIHARLKGAGMQMEYKNVSVRVRRLSHLKLLTDLKKDSVRNAKYFELSTHGLLYYLANWPAVSPESLVKYKDNLILKTLLFSYFEESTVVSSGVAYEIIQYLKRCCHMILSSFDYIRRVEGKHKKKAQEMILKQLENDLEWEIKILAFTLITKKADMWHTVEPYFWPPSYLEKQIKEQPDFIDKYPSQQHTNLMKDKKFMKIAQNVRNDYERELKSWHEK